MISIFLLPINASLGLFCFLNYSFDVNMIVGMIGMLCAMILASIFSILSDSKEAITHNAISISSFITVIIMNLVAYKMTHFPQGLNLI